MLNGDDQARPPPAPARPSEMTPGLKLVGGKVPTTTEELFDEAVRTHSRRLLAIARGIVGYRASAEDVVPRYIFLGVLQVTPTEQE